TAIVSSAVQKDAGSYRTTYWGFGFEGLPDDNARQDAMRRVVNWCAFQADLSIKQQVMPLGALKPGQPVTYSLTFRNSGVTTATATLLTDTLPAALTNLSVANSGASLAQLPGVPYRWQIADLAPGASGTITITGVVNSALTADDHSANSATISTGAFDSDVSS